MEWGFGWFSIVSSDLDGAAVWLPVGWVYGEISKRETRVEIGYAEDRAAEVFGKRRSVDVTEEGEGAGWL